MDCSCSPRLSAQSLYWVGLGTHRAWHRLSDMAPSMRGSGRSPGVQAPWYRAHPPVLCKIPPWCLLHLLRRTEEPIAQGQDPIARTCAR